MPPSPSLPILTPTLRQSLPPNIIHAIETLHRRSAASAAAAQALEEASAGLDATTRLLRGVARQLGPLPSWHLDPGHAALQAELQAQRRVVRDLQWRAEEAREANEAVERDIREAVEDVVRGLGGGGIQWQGLESSEALVVNRDSDAAQSHHFVSMSPLPADSRGEVHERSSVLPPHLASQPPPRTAGAQGEEVHADAQWIPNGSPSGDRSEQRDEEATRVQQGPDLRNPFQPGRQEQTRGPEPLPAGARGWNTPVTPPISAPVHLGSRRRRRAHDDLDGPQRRGRFRTQAELDDIDFQRFERLRERNSRRWANLERADRDLYDFDIQHRAHRLRRVHATVESLRVGEANREAYRLDQERYNEMDLSWEGVMAFQEAIWGAEGVVCGEVRRLEREEGRAWLWIERDADEGTDSEG